MQSQAASYKRPCWARLHTQAKVCVRVHPGGVTCQHISGAQHLRSFPKPYPKSKVALSKNSQQLREKQRLEGHAKSYQVKQHDNPCVGQVLRFVGGGAYHRCNQFRQKAEATGQPHSGKRFIERM
jgi:hypothetical protein